MRLEGLHHITAITADAPRNVEFHVRVLGLRMVKKTVNFDEPSAYHLYYGDEQGTPGSILTFFEFPGAAPGRAGAGMVHKIRWRVGSPESIAFWEDRLAANGVDARRTDGDGLGFTDPEGLAYELVVVGGEDAALTASAPDIPAAHALQGFDGVHAYAADPTASAPLLQELGFTAADALGFTAVDTPAVWRLGGGERHAWYGFDTPPPEPGIQGAGTVHHVAWSAADDAELEEEREVVTGSGGHPTPIIDRQYFHSVYFREPSGVLFELATRDIGFAVDEPLETLGAELKLPHQHEHLRAELERRLTPLPDPRPGGSV
jgi:glyoxalase family protein